MTYSQYRADDIRSNTAKIWDRKWRSLRLDEPFATVRFCYHPFVDLLRGERDLQMTNEGQNEIHVLNESQAARYLGVSGAVLRLWRSQGKGPRYFRAGAKLVRYRRADLDAWIEARLSAPAALELL